MFEFLQDIDNYEDRKVAKDTSKSGLIVSTVYTSDEGYETAVIDSSVHPVERYVTKELAEVGHQKWLWWAHSAKSGVEITELGGFGGLIPDTKVNLEF